MMYRFISSSHDGRKLAIAYSEQGAEISTIKFMDVFAESVTFANFADQFAFVLWQCGHPDFQPKK